MAAGVAALQAYRDETALRTRPRARSARCARVSERSRETHAAIGEMRGTGAFFGIELVADRETREPLVPWQGRRTLGAVLRDLLARGLYMFGRYNVVVVAPPLVITEDEIDEAVAILDEALARAGDRRTYARAAHPVLDPATREVARRRRRSDAARTVRAPSPRRTPHSPRGRQVPVVERARLMMRYADALERRHEDLAIVGIARERQDDRRRAGRSAARHRSRRVRLRHAVAHDGRRAAGRRARRGFAISVRKPLGVCVGITPFNFPAMIPLWMVPIALAAGNTFVLKPSPQTPLTSDMLAEIARECGFPDGIFSVVHGEVADGRSADRASATSPPYRSSDRRRSRASMQERAVARAQARASARRREELLVVMPDGVNAADAATRSCRRPSAARASAVWRDRSSIAVGNAADALRAHARRSARRPCA